MYRAANGYVVAVVAGTRPEGFKPLEEVKDQIRGQVVAERQIKKRSNTPAPFRNLENPSQASRRQTLR